MSEKDGGAAFPQHIVAMSDAAFAQATNPGMSLRDYLASQAIHFFSGPAAQSQLLDEITKRTAEDSRVAVTINKVVAKRCYMLADEMIRERLIARDDQGNPK